MEQRYNVYFSGQLQAGQQLQTVRANIAKLFNADEATLGKLFSGRPQLLKRDCDRATALKYKQAIEKAGATPIIQSAETQGSQPAQVQETSERPNTESRQQTAAEKIAALAAAPDLGGSAAESEPQQTSNISEGGSQPAADPLLAPPGTEVLRPEERKAPEVSSVDTPALEVAASGERLSAVPPPAPPPPDTSHLSEGAVGDIIPNLPSAELPVELDISAIDLSPDGTDLSDCARPEAPPPNLDLSGFDLAPAGSDVVEEKYRTSRDVPAPDTDHLSLKE
ncbi:MAG: hypothetical protein AAF699_10970 [Pseudomonadota bacterium]